MTNGLIYDFSVSDEELLNRCRDNDQAALRELMRRHERPVYSMLYRMLGSREDAEEALADVFIKVWRGAGSFKGEAKFTTWLYRIAANTARDKLRSRQARPEVAIEDQILTDTDLVGTASVDPEKSAIVTEDIDKLNLAMGKLPKEDRLLISLYHIQEFSIDEIARIMGANRANVKVKLFRARRKLRLHLEKLNWETGNNELQRGTTESFGI